MRDAEDGGEIDPQIELEQGQVWRDSLYPLFGCLTVLSVRDAEVDVIEADTSVYADAELTLDRARFEQRITDGELYRDGAATPHPLVRDGDGTGTGDRDD